MKKIYSLTFTGLLIAGLSAQVRTANFDGTPTNHSLVNASQYSTDRAVGDTLMYMPFPEYICDSIDGLTFDIQFNDQDGTPANANLNPPWSSGSNFLLFYSAPPSIAVTPWDNLYHADTAYYVGSTSWLEPVGQADDWTTFGPVTIPATGATLGYRVYTPDGAYRDGYKVYIGSIGVAPTDFSPSDEVFHKVENTGSLAEDTVWTYRQLNIPAAFAGTQAYFAFQNESNDMFILEFDEFVVKEADNLGFDDIQMDGFAFNQVMPNPAKDYAYINYEIGKDVDVSFTVTDINGRVVANLYQGVREMGVHNYALDVTTFNAGVYFVTLQAGQFNSTKKLIVAK